MNKLAEIIFKEAERINKEVDLSKLAGKTVIITGASGLVGTYFLTSLRQVKKVKAAAVVQSQPLKYWQELAKFSGCQVVKADLTKEAVFRRLPKADYIIHAAGYGQPGRFLSEPIQTVKLNTFTVFKLLEKLKPGGRLLYISSSEVYCSAEINQPRFGYIEAKKAGEAICLAAQHQGRETKIARLSLAYGPGTKPGDQRALNELIEKGLLQRQVSLLDKGRARRVYGYVTDSVEIMWQILLQGKDGIYDVAGESATTIFGLARKISQYLQVPLRIGKDRGMAGAPKIVKINIDKIKKEFHKTKFVSLEEGLKQTIEWQRRLYAD